MGKKILTSVLVGIMAVFVAAAFISVKNRPQTVPQEGDFRTIHEVQGVSFGINSSIINKATAVSEISEKIDIDPSLLYVYKDGKDNYILFGLNSIVVAVEKGTHFPLHKDMTELDIEESSVCGIWFEKNGLKLQADYTSDSVTFNANGGLNISNNTYSDYVGKLRILSDGETQWAIFCGIPGTEKYKNLTDSQKNGIETIVNSLQFSDYVAPVNDEVYAVTIDNSVPVTDVAVAETVTEEPTTEETVSEEESTSSETEAESQPEDKGTEIVVEEPSESDIPEETSDAASEELSDTPAEDSIEPESTEESTEPAYVKEKEEEIKEKGSAVSMDNQKVVMNKKNNEAYSSDIYSMLSLKDNGIISEYDIKSKQIVMPIINVSRIYKGKTAVEMIKQYCKDTGYYEYFDAPVGCEWHIAEYNILYKDCPTKPYINIKLRGIDGNNIIYKGIGYSKRTYDMFNKASWHGDYYGTCYCFYAVPIGVREYALECGMGTVNENIGGQAAYYHIKY